VPCDQCHQLDTHCIPRFGLKAPLACEWCSQRKSRCSHVGLVVTSTLTTDIAAWTAAVRDGVERVASAMDHHTDLFGRFIDKMRRMREAVDRLSASAASSSQAAASMVADEEEDEEAVGKEEQEEDVAVDVTMGEVGDESGGDEEEDDDDDDDKDEEGGEEGRSGSGGAEQDAAPEASVSVQVVDRPCVPQVRERPRVPRPQWRVWRDKGKGKMRWEK
jgi:hypothetical protein